MVRFVSHHRYVADQTFVSVGHEVHSIEQVASISHLTLPIPYNLHSGTDFYMDRKQEPQDIPKITLPFREM